MHRKKYQITQATDHIIFAAPFPPHHLPRPALCRRSYTKIVVKGMTRAEMLLKVVMSPHERAADYVEQYGRLLPESDAAEFQKVLDMKVSRRAGNASARGRGGTAR